MTGVGSCISCATVSGTFQPPGGVVYDSPQWVVVLRANPVRLPCLPLIILKHHIEDVSNLNPQESSSLGPVMQVTAKALQEVLQPAKVHFGIYAEQVKHIHVHVFPRMPRMPAGNIPNMWIGLWMDLLHAMKLKKAYSNEEVAPYAEKLRRVYRDLQGSR